MSHPQEKEIRQAVFDALLKIPTGGQGQPPQGIVHAEDFSGILRSLGLEFGQPVVDRIMTQCEMDEQGWVDYRAFGNAVVSGHQQLQQQQLQRPRPSSTSSGELKPYHFSQAAPPTSQNQTPAQNTSRA
jgi:hypothetical protein